MSATLPDLWAEVEHKAHTLSQLSMAMPTLVIPYDLMEFYRQKALSKVAEFIGGDYRSGNIARMVDSAQRKLLHVYNESEVGSGFING